MDTEHQTHLRQLESESIQIMREVVAEFENPVMLYSVGKDSAVMLHLARKAFYQSSPPFPLLHVDTTWKFHEMIEFRDRISDEYGLKLLVHSNQEGIRQNINPFTHGSAYYTGVMKTEALKQALENHGFDAAFGGARRDEEKSRAKGGYSRSAVKTIAGTPRLNARNYGTYTMAVSTRAKASAPFRFQIGPNWMFGNIFRACPR
jgi:sulfate adenylyltransferase subunit 2